MKILCTGSRFFSDIECVGRVLDHFALQGFTTVVVGDAPGADHLVTKEARSRRLVVLRYEADWDHVRPRERAGPLRNRKMLDENPDVTCVVFFHDTIDRASKGTRDMVLYALSKCYPVLNSRSLDPDWRSIE